MTGAAARDRVILHCDCNSFFASVETAHHPEYAQVPMAVAGDKELRHGIILAKNELAKHFGVATAETIAQARKKCPGLLLVPPHYEEYVKYSRAVSEIYARYTDMIEPFGIDESWLDVTASERLWGSGEEIATRIRAEVKAALGITVSVGISFNKVFAKLGSDYRKPDAQTLISRENFRQIVYPLPVGMLLFVGAHTEVGLRAIGVRTVGDLAAVSPSVLRMKFGKAGEMLGKYARGEDDSPVCPEHESAKSISNGYTFARDLIGEKECRQGMAFLTEEIGSKLRRAGMVAGTVSLKIKDPYLRTVQKQMPLTPPTDIGREIAEGAFVLYRKMWQGTAPVRMLTVSVSGLMPKERTAEQISLFPETERTKKREKDERREEAVDEIRSRFGTASIVSASLIDRELDIFGKKP